MNENNDCITEDERDNIIEKEMSATLKSDINNFLYDKVRGNLKISEFEDLSIKINDLIWKSFNNGE